MNISINSYKNRQEEYLRQEKLSNKYPVCLYIKKAREYFNLPRKGKRYRKVKERFIQFLIDQSIKYEVVYGFQATIAEYLKCEERHLRRVIRELRHLEWITVINTTGMCNIYILNPIFNDRSFCIEMNYIWDHLLIDKEIYRAMYINQNIHMQSDKPDIKSIQFQETVYDDERFRPAKTDQKELSKIFGPSKMSSIYIKEYTNNKTGNWIGKITGKEIGLTGLTSKNNLKTGIKKPENKQLVFKKETFVMQDLYSKQLLPVNTGLKSIRLTLWGQIRLSCYPDEAILYADEQMLKLNKPVNNPFKYMAGICDNWCKQNEIPVAWSYMFQLAREQAMPDNGPFYDSNFIPVKPVTQSTGYKKNYHKGEGNKSVESKPWSYYVEHNRSIRDELAPWLKDQPKPKTALEEFHETEQTDPERFVRLTKSAMEFRKMLGLNEDGTFQPGRTAQEAVNILLSGKIQEKVRIDNDINGGARENGNINDYSGFNDLYSDMDSGELADYSSDPFGDHQ